MSEASPLDISQMNGLDLLRLSIEGVLPTASIATTLAFDLVEADEGRVVFRARTTAAVLNPMGTVHGGWMATLLDSACGCAVHSMLKPRQAYATLELKTAYHKPLKADVPVVVVGRIVQMGRRAAFAEADLRGLDDGVLYASATSTCLVTEF